MQPKRKLPPWTDCLSPSEQKAHTIFGRKSKTLRFVLWLFLSLSLSLAPASLVICIVLLLCWLVSLCLALAFVSCTTATEQKKRRERERESGERKKSTSLYSRVNHNREESRVCWSHWKSKSYVHVLFTWLVFCSRCAACAHLQISFCTHTHTHAAQQRRKSYLDRRRVRRKSHENLWNILFHIWKTNHDLISLCLRIFCIVYGDGCGSLRMQLHVLKIKLILIAY